MKVEYIFPILLILLQIGAAVAYAAQKDMKMFTYWLAAAVINIAVTF